MPCFYCIIISLLTIVSIVFITLQNIIDFFLSFVVTPKSVKKAIEKDNVKKLLKHLDTGFDWDLYLKDFNEHPIWHAAGEKNSPNVIPIIMKTHKYSVHPDYKDRADTAFDMAILDGYIESANAMLLAGFDPKKRTVAPLHYAAEGDRLEIVDNLVNYGLDIDSFRQTYTDLNSPATALMIAAYHGNYKFVKLLIEKYNANVNLKTPKGFTAIDFALRSEAPQDEIIEYLENLFVFDLDKHLLELREAGLPEDVIKTFNHSKTITVNSKLEPGKVIFAKPSQMRFSEIIHIDENSEKNYKVPCIDLIYSSEYNMNFLLIWLINLKVYATYDDEHESIIVFPDISWHDILEQPLTYLEAQWAMNPVDKGYLYLNKAFLSNRLLPFEIKI